MVIAGLPVIYSTQNRQTDGADTGYCCQSPTMPSFAGFQAISPSIHLRHPPGLTVDSDSGLGPTIILCTWMEASPKLISRYAEIYTSTFPTSTIILITSSVSSFIYTAETEWARKLAPVVELLRTEDQKEDANDLKRKTVIGIAYSNGGLQSLVQLALAYRSDTDSPLYLRNTILDSAPGSPEITVSHRAMSLSLNLPRLPVYMYYPASSLLWIYLGLSWLYMALLGVENPIDGVRDRINDPSLFKKGGRVYIYSKEDEMVPWEWVLANARLAEKRGWAVEQEEFKGSKHVAHAVVDRDRYWSIIKRAVEQ